MSVNANTTPFMECYLPFFRHYLQDINDDVADGAWIQIHVDSIQSALDSSEELGLDLSLLNPCQSAHDLAIEYLRS